jgi:hypothetical protein
METVWIHLLRYGQEIRHTDHLRVAATREAAEEWMAEIDPNGTMFEYEVLTGRCAQ